MDIKEAEGHAKALSELNYWWGEPASTYQLAIQAGIAALSRAPQLEEKVRVLEEALRPLAEAWGAGPIGESTHDNNSLGSNSLNVGDIRKARAALKGANDGSV